MSQLVKIVSLGGAHGQSTLLTGLKKLPELDLTAICSSFDTGGSASFSKAYSYSATVDLMRCVIALSDLTESEKLIMEYRITKNMLDLNKEYSFLDLCHIAAAKLGISRYSLEHMDIKLDKKFTRRLDFGLTLSGNIPIRNILFYMIASEENSIYSKEKNEQMITSVKADEDPLEALLQDLDLSNYEKSRYLYPFHRAIDRIHNHLVKKGKVYPITSNYYELNAISDTWETFFTETEIDNRTRGWIREIFLQHLKFNLANSIETHSIFLRKTGEKFPMYLRAKEAIDLADYVIIGPGDLYTSILPTSFPDEIQEGLLKNKKIIYVCNTYTKNGETEGYKGEKFIDEIKKYFGKAPDYVIANDWTKVPEVYKGHNGNRVVFEHLTEYNGSKIIIADISLESNPTKHDPDKLAAVVNKIIQGIYY